MLFQFSSLKQLVFRRFKCSICCFLTLMVAGFAQADESTAKAKPGLTSAQMTSEICQTHLQMGSLDQVNQATDTGQSLEDWKLRRFTLNYNGSNGYEILRVVARVFIEYPPSFLKITEEGVFLNVPVDQFDRIFKRSYSEVIEQLSRVTVMVSTEFEFASPIESYEAFLLSAETASCEGKEWGIGGVIETNIGRCLVLHPKFGSLMKFHEEPAIVGFYSEEGSVFHREVNRPQVARGSYY